MFVSVVYRLVEGLAIHLGLKHCGPGHVGAHINDTHSYRGILAQHTLLVYKTNCPLWDVKANTQESHSIL